MRSTQITQVIMIIADRRVMTRMPPASSVTALRSVPAAIGG